MPNLKWNLIFSCTLDSHECDMNIENSIINVIRGAMKFMSGIKKNGLYMLDGHIVCGEVIVT